MSLRLGLLLLGGVFVSLESAPVPAGERRLFSPMHRWQTFADQFSEASSYAHYLSEPLGSRYGYPSPPEEAEAERLLDWGVAELTIGLPGAVQGTFVRVEANECVGPKLGEAPTQGYDPRAAAQAALLVPEDPVLRLAQKIGLDPEMFRGFLAAGVPYQPLYRALEYWAKNPDFVTNRKRLTVVDFTRHANEDRFWVLDLEKGAIQLQTKVAAGRGSDARPRDGMLESCSNQDGTLKTSHGAMRIASGRYSTSHDWGSRRPNHLLLEGGERDNSQAFQRGIVIHGANYCSDSSCMGRSHGCFAIPQGQISAIASDVAGGSLLYAYAPQCEARR